MEITEIMEFFGLGVIFGIFLCYFGKVVQLMFDAFKKFF